MSESDSALFNVDINNCNGPLDVLLDLAKAQKVNLEDISITKLADQFYQFITIHLLTFAMFYFCYLFQPFQPFLKIFFHYKYFLLIQKIF